MALVVLLRAVEFPDTVEELELADPVEPEEVVCEAAGRAAILGGGGEGALDTVGVEGSKGRGGERFVTAGAAGPAEVVGCLLRRRSRCLGFSFSALESCKAEKKVRA